MSLTLVIFPEVAPIRYAHHIATLCGLVITSAGMLGPILGGVFAHFVTWRWIFWIKFVRFFAHAKGVLTRFAVLRSSSCRPPAFVSRGLAPGK